MRFPYSLLGFWLFTASTIARPHAVDSSLEAPHSRRAPWSQPPPTLPLGAFPSDFKVGGVHVEIPDDPDGYLGQGTFGTVLKGKANGKDVAVKCVNSMDTDLFKRPVPRWDKKKKSYIEQEIQNMATFAADIGDSMPVLKVGGQVEGYNGQSFLSRKEKYPQSAGYQLAIVMERAKGLDLLDQSWKGTFRQSGQLNKKIMSGILEIAQKLYDSVLAGKRGFHGDLNSANIMTDTDGKVTFIDWAAAGHSNVWENAATMPPPFQSPEMVFLPPLWSLTEYQKKEIKQKGISPQLTDMWAVGVNLFFILFGKDRHSGVQEGQESWWVLWGRLAGIDETEAHKVFETRVSELCKKSTSVSETVVKFFRKFFDTNPVDRWQTPHEASQALQSIPEDDLVYK